MPQPRPVRPRPRIAQASPSLAERIEPRLHLSTYTVANANGFGAGSFPQAILDANSDPGPDLINFASGLPRTLAFGGLPHISDATGATTIQGPGTGVLEFDGIGGRQVFVIDQGASAVISGLSISRTSNSQVGGAILNSGTLAVSDCTFSSDQGLQGGAIANTGTLAVTDCTFTNDSAGQSIGGGAILNAGDGTIIGCTFSKNFGHTNGAAITNSGGLLRAMNCTFNANGSASGEGGAIYNTNSSASNGIANLTNCTVVGNLAPSGGGIYNDGGALTLNNTIVAGNIRSTTGPADDISGTVTGGYNLIGTGGSGGLADGTDGNHVGLPLDQLRLGALADYGGPTLTMFPGWGSPAVDAGSTALAISADGQPLPHDQRGLARVAGAAVDIGAAEYQSVAVNTQHDGASAAGEFSLRSAVNAANVSPGPDQITFDPAVFASGTLHTILLGFPLVLTDTTGATTITGPGSAVLAIRASIDAQAISIGSGAVASLTDLAITGGPLGSGRYAGGIANSGTLDASRCLFSGNESNNPGGAIHNLPGATLAARDCTFSGNGASAVYNESSATLARCTFSGNGTGGHGGAVGYGGAIFNNGTLTVTDSSFVGNATYSLSTLTGGGALCNQGTAVVSGCTFSRNSAPATTEGDGGAIYNGPGSLTLTNCTLTGNSAQTQGGAIENSGTLSLLQCTITANQLGIDTSTMIVSNNSIVSGNAAGLDISGPVEGANNLVGRLMPAGLINGVNGNIVGVTDPMLALLGNYGGPTQTMPPLAGSPTIDAGSNALALLEGNPLTTDQRGHYRVFNGTVDIGACEFGSVAVIPGDVNQDGTVDFADLLKLAQSYGATNAIWTVGDMNGDGRVDFADLLLLAQNYGRSAAPAVAASSFDWLRPARSPAPLNHRVR